MSNGWQALQRGESVRERRRLLERAHERFVADDSLQWSAESRRSFAAESALRPVVLESWLRSRERLIDPDVVPEAGTLSGDELAELQRIHPIARVLPVINRLLLNEASGSGFIVAIGDAAGRLLWIDGDRRLRSQAEDMGFAVGADWSETAVGTSAPGAALSENHAIQVLGAEHYNRAVHKWSCTAAPVHDPESGAIIGVIDVTGSDAAASPHMLPLVEATLAAVEAELKLEALRTTIERERERERGRERGRDREPARGQGEGGSPRGRNTSVASGSPGARDARWSTTLGDPMPGRGAQPVHRPTPRLVLLGRDPALLECGDQYTPVAGRHAEILVALAASPQGLNAASLAELVYGEGRAVVTLRPEVVRLRKWLAHHDTGVELMSRPYRLSMPLRLDAHQALDALARGAHRVALAAYEGPVLPSSSAPAVAALRNEVDATLRESMLQAATVELLFEYAQNWASEDAQVWEALLHELPPLSPKRTRVVARLEAIAAAESAAARAT